MFQFFPEPQASSVRGRTSGAAYPRTPTTTHQSSGIPRMGPLRFNPECQHGSLGHGCIDLEAWAASFAIGAATGVARRSAARPLGCRLAWTCFARLDRSETQFDKACHSTKCSPFCQPGIDHGHRMCTSTSERCGSLLLGRTIGKHIPSLICCACDGLA